MGALRRSMPVLAAVIVVAGCAPPGIVNSGRLVRLDSGEICIEEPDGNRKCFPTEEETVIPARIGIGDVVSVRVVEGRAKEVEIATPG